MTETTLRFLTCGHVDDGKSTLIGRLLYDLEAVPQDQLQQASHNGAVNLAQITDGLEDERARGITIDVAYRYFRHGERYFIVADAPGHLEYLRNMAVAASNSDVALILLDATHGLREQTLRHSHVAAFFGIKHFVIVINKMDAVNYDAEIFQRMRSDYIEGFGEASDINLSFIPASALKGDNVTRPSEHMSWYKGPTVIEYLTQVTPAALACDTARIIVQQDAIAADGSKLTLGMLTEGTLKEGDKLFAIDVENRLIVSAIYHSGKRAESVGSGSSIAVSFTQPVKLSRGSILSGKADIQNDRTLTGRVLWLDEDSIAPEKTGQIVRLYQQESRVEVQLTARKDFLHDIHLEAQDLLNYDIGSPFLLIHPETNRVQAVGMVS